MRKIISDHRLVHMPQDTANVGKKRRDEDGRRLQSASSSVIMPEAALSGTIPYRPPNSTATVEMPVQQDIQCEVIQRELSLKKEKKKKGKAVLHYHRAVRQNTAMHLNIYRN